MSRPIDVGTLEARAALVTDRRVSLGADGNLLNTNQPDNSALAAVLGISQIKAKEEDE